MTSVSLIFSRCALLCYLLWFIEWVPVIPHKTDKKCPKEIKALDPVSMANVAAGPLLVEGKILEAQACTKRALKLAPKYNVSEEALTAMAENMKNFIRILTPKNDLAVTRFYHNIGNKDPGFPANSSDPLSQGRPDKSIMIFDGALSDEQCTSIIDLFERSELYDGNVIRAGEIIVDSYHKKAKEYDISGSAVKDGGDAIAVDRLLVSMLYRHLALYEEANPAVRTMSNPFGDEGFTMRRYNNDGTEHHGYHIDGGQEKTCWPRRAIAVLIYVNDVAEGGETVFLNQGIAVKPQCGRVLFFPTAFTHVHAGRRPVSNPKYLIRNFLTIV